MNKLLVHSERFLARLQGKGWGASTIKSEVKFCLKFLSNRNNPVIFDVGANSGNWTSTFYENIPGSTIVMVEPSKTNIEKLEKRFKEVTLNPQAVELGKKYLIPIALSSVTGTQTLYADVPGSGLGSLTQRNIINRDDHGNHSETVETRTLNEVTKGMGISYIDILKIDVEGHELDVLQGGDRLFSSGKVGQVQFEFGGCNIDTRSFLRDFYNFFKKYDYTLYRMSPMGLIPIKKYYEGLECFDCTNYLAVYNH